MIVSRAKYEADMRAATLRTSEALLQANEAREARDQSERMLESAFGEIGRMKAELSRLYDYEAKRDKEVAQLRIEHAELRGLFDISQSALRDALAAQDRRTEEIAWLRAQLASKDEAILTMKREGFAPPAPPAPNTERPDDSLPVEVRKAIEKVAEPGSALWMSEVARARRELATREPTAIAADIERGSGFNPFHA